jgi:UDP-glucose 4-epimerase
VQSKRVLVFGGLGFIGVNVARRFSKEGAEVTIADISTPPDMKSRLKYVSGSVNLVKVNITNKDDVQTILVNQDVVLCLAGVSGAVNSNRCPQRDLEINFIGTLNILDAAKELESSALYIFPGSWLQYGVTGNKRVNEMHPMRSLSVYGINKMACEELFRLYHKLYGIRTVTFRISNPYGPFQSVGQRHYGLVNNFIHSAMNDGELIVFGEGNQFRDLIHIEDVVDAFTIASTSDDIHGEAFNLGFGTSSRLVEVAELIIEICGSGRITHVDWPEEYLRIEPGDYFADISKISKTLMWRPQKSLEMGIMETVESMKEYKE